MLESRTKKHKPHPRLKYFWFLPLVVAGIAVYDVWPKATVLASHSALASVAVQGHLTKAVATGRNGKSIRLIAKNGQLWPVSTMNAGTAYTIHLTVAGPSWLPFGSRHISKTIVTPQDPILANRAITVEPNQAFDLSLSSPASILHIVTNQNSATIRASRPQLIYSIHSPGNAPGERGTLTVQTQARAWESVSTPKTLSWRTPNWLKVSASPHSTASMGLHQPLVLTFSHPVARTQVTPTLSPQVKGKWVWKNSTTEEFIPQPSGWGYGPGQVVKVTIPGGVNGYHSTKGAYFPNTITLSWSTAPGSTLRLQELLAKLGYLPLKWIPNSPVPATLSSQITAMMNPPAGQFQWAYSSTPSALKSLWSPNQYTVMVKGAVMNFERVHNLPVDGIAGPQVWHALIQADLTSKMNPDGYSYVYVSENLPETLTLWHNGSVVLKSLANTGIPQSPTYLGTFPVYQRYLSQTMQGVNPNGVPYHDPGVPYVNYFNGGDAVHGFPRARYGFPQSLGCVELPIPEAAKVWPYLHYGTLVTVVPPTSSTSGG